MTKTDEILRHTQTTAIKVAKIEEHLKNINGSVQRHETNVDDLYTKYGENKTKLDRIWGGIAVVGLVAGAIGAFILNILSKLWR